MFLVVGLFWIFLMSAFPLAIIFTTAFGLILELATRLGPLTTALIENPRNSEGLFLRLVIFDFSGLISKSNRSFSQSLTAINIRSASDLVLHMILRSSAYLIMSVSYTHLRAHETRHDLVCRLLLEKKK